MRGALETGLAVVTGSVPTVLAVGDTLYIDVTVGGVVPYVRLTRTAAGYTLALSSGTLVLSTTDVPVGGSTHPDGVASALVGLIFRSQSIFAAGSDSAEMDLSEWPPGRVTSFALMLATQTHPALDVPFSRTSLTPSSSVWTRADRQRTISTEYKEDCVELSDSGAFTTKVLVYPVGLRWIGGVWDCKGRAMLMELLRGLWLRMAQSP
jgi:hypothetical protein